MAINTGDLPEAKGRNSYWEKKTPVEEPHSGRSQSVRSSASKREGARTNPTARRRVTIAGVKGRRKMDTKAKE